ncbi:MAG TPA: CRTAC1 family protein [Gemmataceae bacterium]|nr:CRTAC1 family protein [Gemmataceae bacterium]
MIRFSKTLLGRRSVRRWLWPMAAVIASGLLALGCFHSSPSAPRPDPAPVDPPADGPGFFADVTAASGVDFQYRNGEEADLYTILESLGGGVALLDYDRDGKLDIFLTGGGYFDPKDKTIKGHPNRLYHNEGGGRFRDVTAEVGLDKPLFYSHGVAVADYDNDGWPDLLVTGYGRMALFHNNHGKFEEVTEAAHLLGPNGPLWSTSAAWADFDGDGWPDLFVGQYVDWNMARNIPCPLVGPGGPPDVCSPTQFGPLPPKLYLNNHDGTFRDASEGAGLKPGKTLGVVVVDVDDDGRPDVYVANDTVPNQLYLNKGGGKFEEVGVLRGVAMNEWGRAAGSMGVDAADYDGSGRFSLFVANFVEEAHGLYHNRGGGLFDHASSRSGLTSIGLNFVGFGASFLDYDNDGAEDILIVNGHVLRHPPSPQTQAQRAVLFHNTAPGGRPSATVRFEDISGKAGAFFRGKHRGRGLAVGDLDDDGKVDAVVSCCEEPAAVLHNIVDNGNHWLGIQLQGNPYRDAVGARLTLESPGRRLVRAVKGGGSYLSSSDRRVVFGLGGDAAVDRLTVQWPSGEPKVQVWEGAALKTDRYWRLVQGEAQPHPWATEKP